MFGENNQNHELCTTLENCLPHSRNLNIHFVVEDNGKSVCSNTRKTWSIKKLSFENKNTKYISYYKYKLKYPHAGAGKRVQF